MQIAIWCIAVACGWALALQEEPTWRRHWPGCLPGGSALRMNGFLPALPVAAAYSLGCPSCVVGAVYFGHRLFSHTRLGCWRPLWAGLTHTVQRCCCLRRAAGHCSCACDSFCFPFLGTRFNFFNHFRRLVLLIFFCWSSPMIEISYWAFLKNIRSARSRAFAFARLES